MSTWKEKYNNHKMNAVSGSDLTLDEYISKGEEAGITPDQIGNRPGQYNLGRIGDRGRYTTENCRFITVEQNRAEKVQNGGAARGGQKAGDTMRGVSCPNRGTVGKDHHLHKGMYVTPAGEFESSYSAAEANGCSQKAIMNRCHNPDAVVSPKAHNFWKIYGRDCVGKTYRELGWYFYE